MGTKGSQFGDKRRAPSLGTKALRLGTSPKVGVKGLVLGTNATRMGTRALVWGQGSLGWEMSPNWGQGVGTRVLCGGQGSQDGDKSLGVGTRTPD